MRALACSAGRPQEIPITSSFQALGLSAKLLRALSEQNFTTPTPIQAQAIPIMLAGGDLLATAQTGTGKTAGFVLPMLDRLSVAPKQKGARRHIRALILTPTRELAAQVEQNIRMLGAYAGFVSAAVYGGVSIRNQIVALQKGVDVLVATPGRLLDHVQQKTVDLSAVEIFVLDEADRMLDMGFAPDVRRISNLLSRERQTAMFSATFSRETRALANATLRSPQQVEVGRTDRPAELVEQEAYQVPQEHKTVLLRHLIETRALHQVLVFTRTKHGADRLSKHLERAGIDADAIHGDKRQAQRLKALARFKDGELQVLVATDVAARGLDISALPAVVNYDVPGTPEAYVHRIGRTGRAGAKGCAISLVAPAERAAMADVERHLQCRITRRTPEGLVPPGGGDHDLGEAPEHSAARPRRDRGERPSGGAARSATRGDRQSARSERPGTRGQRPAARSEQQGGRAEHAPSRGEVRGARGGKPDAHSSARRGTRSEGATAQGERPHARADRSAPRRDRTDERQERSPSRDPRALEHAGGNARRGQGAVASNPRAVSEGQGEAPRGVARRNVRARHSEDPAQRGERSPRRNVGNVFRSKDDAQAASKSRGTDGGKRSGFIGAIARFLGS